MLDSVECTCLTAGICHIVLESCKVNNRSLLNRPKHKALHLSFGAMEPSGGPPLQLVACAGSACCKQLVICYPHDRPAAMLKLQASTSQLLSMLMFPARCDMRSTAVH